jgi:hypothetical protein
VVSFMKKYAVDEFADRLYSRMRPEGTTVSGQVLSVFSNPRADRKVGEAKSGLTYLNHDLYVGHDEDGNQIWVRVVAPEGSAIDESLRRGLEGMLKHPEEISGSKKMRSTYLRSLGLGRISELDGEGDLTVRYDLKGAKDVDKIFAAFWFHLKPVMRMIQGSVQVGSQ